MPSSDARVRISKTRVGKSVGNPYELYFILCDLYCMFRLLL